MFCILVCQDTRVRMAELVVLDEFEEILLRLDVEDLLQCKSVFPYWAARKKQAGRDKSSADQQASAEGN
ncbi:hypothetical protein Tco_0059321 [Tanacetum coccineum]